MVKEMRFQAALIREQGVEFAVVIVKPHILNDRPRASELMTSFSPHFGGVPVVLMAQDSRGRPTYLGRPDLSRFLSRVPLHTIPWREWDLN